ncbi:hypothetical protein Q8A67_001919 [Cirrhinus molitorella]|uniref:Uncharacterized protein n=1 Tax=Cirrhinus molitorella TaxID=172907 RepID=A0AA88QGK3_9TELE|nr:hypothetical protein Q8A67_001919 [Cirrhinus molitorella]
MYLSVAVPAAGAGSSHQLSERWWEEKNWRKTGEERLKLVQVIHFHSRVLELSLMVTWRFREPDTGVCFTCWPGGLPPYVIPIWDTHSGPLSAAAGSSRKNETEARRSRCLVDWESAAFSREAWYVWPQLAASKNPG